MNSREMLRHPIETARTAPYGTTVTGMNVVLSSIYATYGISTGFIVGLAVSLPFSLLGARSGSGLIKQSLELREQVEENLGDAQRINDLYESNSIFWCGRQAIKTTLRDNPEQREIFDGICAKNEADAHFRWLPHF
jgi:hypothetical protein